MLKYCSDVNIVIMLFHETLSDTCIITVLQYTNFLPALFLHSCLLRCFACRDTAGQERFLTFTKQFFRGAEVCCHGNMYDYVITTTQGIILMYDITSQATFNDIDRWLRTIQEVNVVFVHV